MATRFSKLQLDMYYTLCMCVSDYIIVIIVIIIIIVIILFQLKQSARVTQLVSARPSVREVLREMGWG